MAEEASGGNNCFKEIKRKQYIRGFLAITSCLGFFGVIGWVVIKGLPENATRDILLMLIGAMIVLTKDAFGFYFGSSQGSEQKTDTINTIIENRE